MFDNLNIESTPHYYPEMDDRPMSAPEQKNCSEKNRSIKFFSSHSVLKLQYNNKKKYFQQTLLNFNSDLLNLNPNLLNK